MDPSDRPKLLCPCSNRRERQAKLLYPSVGTGEDSCDGLLQSRELLGGHVDGWIELLKPILTLDGEGCQRQIGMVDVLDRYVRRGACSRHDQPFVNYLCASSKV